LETKKRKVFHPGKKGGGCGKGEGVVLGKGSRPLTGLKKNKKKTTALPRRKMMMYGPKRSDKREPTAKKEKTRRSANCAGVCTPGGEIGVQKIPSLENKKKKVRKGGNVINGKSVKPRTKKGADGGGQIWVGAGKRRKWA